MRIVELFGKDRPVISFEFFPPRTEKGFTSLFRTIAELKRLDPAFVSVTWGAGGSTRRKTVELVIRIQNELGITAMAHISCVGSTREEISAALGQLERGGIENVLPLGGDWPEGYVPPPDAFRYANQLVEFIRPRWDFCMPAACYPETHPRAPRPEFDMEMLVQKVAAGVDFLITQLFFDNDDYFRFLERSRAAGLDLPVVPGIMPVISGPNIRRMTSMCGARIPRRLEERLAQAGDRDNEATLEVGIDWATAQCRELLDQGAPGIHFYTLNRSPATRRIYESLFPSGVP
ncbi:MAG: methylenetetrahydrofolate reductase [NAD(P)H] [Myxococcota bacterium]